MSKRINLFLLISLLLFTGLPFNSYAGPVKVPVPNVTNQPIATARTMITDVNLVVGDETDENDDSIIPGNVTRQDPVAETEVDEESAVDLWVSIGPSNDDDNHDNGSTDDDHHGGGNNHDNGSPDDDHNGGGNNHDNGSPDDDHNGGGNNHDNTRWWGHYDYGHCHYDDSRSNHDHNSSFNNHDHAAPPGPGDSSGCTTSWR